MNREPIGNSEEDDGVRSCCEHGVPLFCPCKRCDAEERRRAAFRRESGIDTP